MAEGVTDKAIWFAVMAGFWLSLSNMKED